MTTDPYQCGACRWDGRRKPQPGFVAYCPAHQPATPIEALSFDWARRWHIDYIPEGVAIPARPIPKPQPEPQPIAQLVRFPIQD